MVAKAADKAVLNIEDEIKKGLAQLDDSVGAGGGNMIKINRNKLFELPDGSTNDTLKVVILAFNTHHLYYDKPYKAGEVNPPVCWAIGDKPKAMIPSLNATELQIEKVEEGCNSCPNFQWGTKNEGKACTTRRMLAVIAPDATAETEILQLSVSPTGLKRFDSYAKTLKARFQALPIGMITTVTFDEAADFATLRFENPVPNPRMAEMFGRRVEAEEILRREPSTD